MFNVQLSMPNECRNGQSSNALNDLIIDHSLTIEHCLLNIADEGGAYG